MRLLISVAVVVVGIAVIMMFGMDPFDAMFSAAVGGFVARFLR